MRQYTASEIEAIDKDEVTLSLEGLIRVGARRMLQAALEFEVDAYVENLEDERDEQGHRQQSGQEWRSQAAGPDHGRGTPYRSFSGAYTTGVRGCPAEMSYRLQGKLLLELTRSAELVDLDADADLTSFLEREANLTHVG